MSVCACAWGGGRVSERVSVCVCVRVGGGVSE